MSRPIPWNLLPDAAAVGDDGWLTIGGCSLQDLAHEFGTPLFVYDETHLRARCREAVQAFPDGAAYATKAFLCRAMARLALEEGLRLDVASSGELHVALAAGATGEQLVFHGNNKSVDELRAARGAGATLVVDSFDELDRLDALHDDDRLTPRVLIRITPDGAIEVEINPTVLALAGGASFIGRGFAGDPKHLTQLIAKAVQHRGYSLVDVLQPCVTYNKINTYDWYKSRVYKLDDEAGYDPSDYEAAWDKAREWDERIPIGVLYQEQDRPTYEEQVPQLQREPLTRQSVHQDRELLEAIKKEFM